jgi:hypothetical protein
MRSRTPVAETVKTLRKLARAGYTRRQAATILGLNYSYLCRLIRAHGAPFWQGSIRGDKAARRQRTPTQHVKSSGLLAGMTCDEKKDVLILIRKGGMSAPDALRAAKRPDLAARVNEFL